MYLLQDKYGSRGNLYGKRGEVVKIVSVSLPAVIVEDVKGDRFSVRMDEISETPPEPETMPIPEPIIDLFNQPMK